MTILVIAEHDQQSLKAATLNTVTAARKIGGDIHVLVAGSACNAAAEQAATLQGVTLVKVADAAHYQSQTAGEPHRADHRPRRRLQPHPRPGHHLRQKSLPRIAALLDVAQISEITAVEVRRHLRPPDLRRQRAGYRAECRPSRSSPSAPPPLMRSTPEIRQKSKASARLPTPHKAR
jgi:electron transfer flavoprotein alpha subunit